MIIKTGIGQDSHRFLPEDTSKPCMLGGLIFDDVPGFHANSDGDVIFHALCNAISSITGQLILGVVADELLNRDGITDSSVYLQEALKTLGKQKITHVAITLEAKRPRFIEKISDMRTHIAKVMNLQPNQIGITATTGEGLNDVGCGGGVQCFCIVTTMEE